MPGNVMGRAELEFCTGHGLPSVLLKAMADVLNSSLIIAPLLDII